MVEKKNLLKAKRKIRGRIKGRTRAETDLKTIQFLRNYISERHFIVSTKAYKKVIEHRKQCPLWHKGFCLECFGHGLSVFGENILDEFVEQVLKDK